MAKKRLSLKPLKGKKFTGADNKRSLAEAVETVQEYDARKVRVAK